MRMFSWVVGLGVLALAIVRWTTGRQRKSTWEKSLDWTSNRINPISRMVMKQSKKMIRGMVR